jgi:hypothetical protein
MKNTTTNTVAETILAQLGGARFVAMTGAKHLCGNANGLSFKLPAHFAKDGINVVLVVLDPSDTYTLTFYKKRGLKCTTVEVVDNVHADSIRAVFTSHTGLETTLGTLGEAARS